MHKSAEELFAAALEGYQMARGFSPDGKWFVSAARERDGMFGVWAWDCTVSNTPAVRGLMPHDQPVLCLDFSPDAARVATGSSNGNAQIWRVGDWTPITGPLQHTGAVTCVAFSPDGERLVTGAETNGSAVARVWDSRTGEPLIAPFRFYLSFFEPNGLLMLRLLGSSFGEHLKLAESWIWNRPDTMLRETLRNDVLSSADVSLAPALVAGAEREHEHRFLFALGQMVLRRSDQPHRRISRNINPDRVHPAVA